MSDGSYRYQKAKFLTLPAVITVALVTQVPIIFTLGLSFVKWIVVRPDLGVSFDGLGNYLRIFTDPEFYAVIAHTIELTAGSLVCCTVLGMFFALLLNRNFLGVNLVRTLIVSPFFVMDAVAGIIWKTLLLHPSFGFNGYIAALFHVKPIDFFGSFSLLTVLVLTVWQWTPFFILILLAGLQGISEETLDSAKVDGAGWLRTLFSIKIPAIYNHIEVAIMLGSIFILKVFGLIFVTTSGGPGVSSTNLPYYVYKVGFYEWDVGRATAIAIVTAVLTLIAIMALFRFFQRRFKEWEV